MSHCCKIFAIRFVVKAAAPTRRSITLPSVHCVVHSRGVPRGKQSYFVVFCTWAKRKSDTQQQCTDSSHIRTSEGVVLCPVLASGVDLQELAWPNMFFVFAGSCMLSKFLIILVLLHPLYKPHVPPCAYTRPVRRSVDKHAHPLMYCLPSIRTASDSFHTHYAHTFAHPTPPLTILLPPRLFTAPHRPNQHAPPWRPARSRLWPQRPRVRYPHLTPERLGRSMTSPTRYARATSINCLLGSNWDTVWYCAWDRVSTSPNKGTGGYSGVVYPLD